MRHTTGHLHLNTWPGQQGPLLSALRPWVPLKAPFALPQSTQHIQVSEARRPPPAPSPAPFAFCILHFTFAHTLGFRLPGLPLVRGLLHNV